MRHLLVILALTTPALAQEPPTFTPDQCRVLRQLGINTRGRCPPVQPPPPETEQAKKLKDHMLGTGVFR